MSIIRGYVYWYYIGEFKGVKLAAWIMKEIKELFMIENNLIKYLVRKDNIWLMM